MPKFPVKNRFLAMCLVLGFQKMQKKKKTIAGNFFTHLILHKVIEKLLDKANLLALLGNKNAFFMMSKPVEVKIKAIVYKPEVPMTDREVIIEEIARQLHLTHDIFDVCP